VLRDLHAAVREWSDRLMNYRVQRVIAGAENKADSSKP